MDEEREKIKLDLSSTNLDGITETQLEEIVDGWMKHIRKAMKDASEKVLSEITYFSSLLKNLFVLKEPTDTTPISEYELWVSREMEFNNILQQTKSPLVRTILGNSLIFFYN